MNNEPTTLGLLTMVLSNATVITLTTYCLWRVMNLPPVDASNRKVAGKSEPHDSPHAD